MADAVTVLRQEIAHLERELAKRRMALAALTGTTTPRTSTPAARSVSRPPTPAGPSLRARIVSYLAANKAQSQYLCHERQSRKRNEGISNSYPRPLSVKTHALAATGVDRNIWNLQNFFSTLRLTAQLLGLGQQRQTVRPCPSGRGAGQDG
jgi:hypothetical protein